MNFFIECSNIIADLINNDAFKKYENLFNEYMNFILIGNGGSNSIASHISQDFLNKGKVSHSFTDTAMMSCFVNDFGVENMYSRFIEKYKSNELFVIFISSSGNSINIINGILYCEKNNIPYGILTGFDENNSVRSLVKNCCVFDYHVKSNNYGVIECVHQTFLHGAI